MGDEPFEGVEMAMAAQTGEGVEDILFAYGGSEEVFEPYDDFQIATSEHDGYNIGYGEVIMPADKKHVILVSCFAYICQHCPGVWGVVFEDDGQDSGVGLTNFYGVVRQGIVVEF